MSLERYEVVSVWGVPFIWRTRMEDVISFVPLSFSVDFTLSFFAIFSVEYSEITNKLCEEVFTMIFLLLRETRTNLRCMYTPISSPPDTRSRRRWLLIPLLSLFFFLFCCFKGVSLFPVNPTSFSSSHREFALFFNLSSLIDTGTERKIVSPHA